MATRPRSDSKAVASVPNPRSVKTSPPRLPGCPFLELSPDELGQLMSPTLDLDQLGTSQGAPGSRSSGPNYDDFLAVLGRRLGRTEAGKGVRHSLMVECFDWS